jgi:hypothetical protein
MCFACWLFPSIAFAAPSITLSKQMGPPTSKILVSGRGFEPNVGVDIYFDTKDEALVVTDGNGEFHKADIHAPGSAHPGKALGNSARTQWVRPTQIDCTRWQPRSTQMAKTADRFCKPSSQTARPFMAV